MRTQSPRPSGSVPTVSHNTLPPPSLGPQSVRPTIRPTRPASPASGSATPAKTVAGTALSTLEPEAPAALTPFAQAVAALQDRHRAAYPKFDTLISRDVVQQLRAATGLTVDPEQTYLNEYNSVALKDGGGWWNAGQPIRSTSLGDLVRNGFPQNTDWAHYNAGALVDVTRRHTGGGAKLSIAFPVLKNVVETAHPLPQFLLKRMRDFWDEGSHQHGLQQHSLLTSAHAYQSARTQHELGQLSSTAMQMIRQAAGFPENTPVAMHSYALDIGGYRADDIAVMQAADGRTVMYAPGESHAFQEFDDENALRVAIKDLAAGPETRTRLASHFGLSERRDSFKAGIDTLLQRLGTSGHHANIPILQDKASINGDVFDWIARGQRQSHIAEATTLLGTSATYDAATRQYLEGRQQQLFAAATDMFASRDMDKVQSSQDAWRTALTTAMRSTSAAPWARVSALSAPAPTGLRAASQEDQRNIATRRFALAQAEQTLAALEPDLQDMAKQFMSRKLHDTFGFTHDIDKYALVSYHGDRLASHPLSSTGMFGTALPLLDNPRAGEVSEIVPLNRITFTNVPYNRPHDGSLDPGKQNARSVIRKVNNIPKQWHHGMQSALPVKAFVDLVRDDKRFDFEREIQASAKDFYRVNGHAKAALAQQKALLTADIMRVEGTLSESDHALARSGFGLPPALTDPHKDGAEGIATYPLDLKNQVSMNALRITDGSTGRTLLYLPGDNPPIRAFRNHDRAIAWIWRSNWNAQARQRFIANHFSASAADAVSLTLTELPKMLSAGTRIVDPFPRRMLTSRIDISSGPFEWLNGEEAKQLEKDIGESVSSANDIRTNWWLNALDEMPIPYLPALTKSIAAPTIEQRRQGLTAMGMEALTDLFTLGAARGIRPTFNGLQTLWRGVRHGANHLADGTRMAIKPGLATMSVERWFKPPQRINGKIGYPLSPTPVDPGATLRADILTTLSKYEIANKEIKLIGNPYDNWQRLDASSKRLIDEKCALLYKDAQAFFQQNPVPARPPRPVPKVTQAFLEGKSERPYPPPNPEFTEEALRTALSSKKSPLSNGVIFGEDHTNAAARHAIIDRIDDLDAQGVKTLYLESLLMDDAPEALAQFNLTGNVTRQLRTQLTKGHADDAMIDLMMRAHEKGIKIVALDSLAAWQAPDVPYVGSVRIASMNYSALNIIRAEQLANGNKPWVALVGSNHGQRTYGIPGINELTGAISVFSAHATTPYALAKNGLDFSLAVPAPYAADMWPAPPAANMVA